MTVRASDAPLVEGITRRQVGIALLALPVLTMGFVAVPLNLTTIGDGSVPGDTVEVGGYQVTYAEEVPNQRIGAINISVGGQTTAVNASGVIVVDRDRQIWTEAVSTGQLAHSGGATVTVGGLGWRESVEVRREGWQVSGGGTAYIVALRPPGAEFRPVYESKPREAAAVIAGRNVSVVPAEGRFQIAVEYRRNGNGAPETVVARGPLPAVNESVEIGGLDFERVESVVYVTHERTRIPIIKKETYN